MRIIRYKFWFLIPLLLLCLGFLIPEERRMPVAGATDSDWHPDSFWYEPWGVSGVHKGVDVFGQKGASVVAATHQWVLYRGQWSRGGKVVVALGPKWRLHYYAHLDSHVDAGRLVSAGTPIGTLGDSGNARGKQPHLHYTVVSLLPLPWKIDTSTQGYKKAFYLDPRPYLRVE